LGTICAGEIAARVELRQLETKPVPRNQVAASFFDFGNYVQVRDGYLSALALESEIDLLFGDWGALHEVYTKPLALGQKSLDGLSLQDIVDAIQLFQKG
jgi:hypothetical protein